ncbi:hypothetical protein [Parapedobacter sp. 10938]|uniref:hypothetical protein n=1 Tax=Parapedobacter flavus TaxID=3110225 RepID=UPI002DB63E2D|nr:hypothetical protein [Parapedobacter sp. 10938]MEC3878751.1 hypothetical protein [Parapedobacter sp. 10938]
MRLSIILYTLLLCIQMACEKKEANQPIEMAFNLLKEDGEPSTTFKEGENFRFLFVIRNNSSSPINFDPTFVGEIFFKVFRIDSQEGLISVGKPYQNVFCSFDGMQFVISPNSEYRFEIPWTPPQDNCCLPFCLISKNDPLSPGSYRTTIEGPFNFTYDNESFTIDEKYSINFEID